jgi:hypothetical protein
MASVLQLVDVDAETNILFDLNDSAGANSAFYGGVQTLLVQDVSFGSATLGNDASVAAATPRSVAFNRLARRPVSFHSIIKASSYDNLTKAVGVLGRYLADGATLRWIADGSSDRKFIDCDPTNAPALLSGREAALYEATQLFQTPAGVEIALSSLPYLRSDALDPALNKLANATLLLDSNDDGTPNGWTITSTPTLSIVAATDSLHVVAGAATRGIFQATGAASAASGQTWTLSCEVQVASGTMALITDWRTAADATISNVSVTQAAAGWKRISITGTAPGTTDHIRVRIESSGAAATFDVRNVQLEQSASASPFRVAGSQTIVVDPASTTSPPFMMPVYNPGTAPAPCVLDVAFPDASTAGVEADYARLSNDGVMGRNRLADFLNGPNFAQAEATANGWTATLGTDASSVADGNASGGNTLRITHATDPTTAKQRVNLTRSTMMDCLRGRFVVMARVKGAAARLFKLQLVWGPGTSPQYSNDEVDHDLTNATTFNYVPVNLGEIELPEELGVQLGNFTMQLWTRQDSGTAQNLDVDDLWLVPAVDTAAATVSSGGEQSVFGSALTTPPKDLGAGDPTWTAGTVSGTSMVLDTLNDGAGWGDNTNGAFGGVGHHAITFDWNFVSGDSGYTYKVEVANLTDNTIVASQSFTPSPNTSGHQTLILAFDGVAAKVYQPRVVHTVQTSLGTTTIHSMSHTVIPLIVQNQRVRSDPGSLPTRDDVETLDSSGNLLTQMDPSATPFWVPPGLSLVWLNELDVSAAGYVENQATLGRTMTVTPTVYRRDWS